MLTFQIRLFVLTVFILQICHPGNCSSNQKRNNDDSSSEEDEEPKKDSWITRLIIGPTNEDIFHNRVKAEKLYTSYVNSLITKVKLGFNGMKNALTGHRGETQDAFCHSKEKRLEGCRNLLSKSYYRSRNFILNPNKEVGECISKKLIIHKDRKWSSGVSSEPIVVDKMVFNCPFIRLDDIIMSQGANDKSAFVYEELDDNGDNVYVDSHVLNVIDNK